MRSQESCFQGKSVLGEYTDSYVIETRGLTKAFGIHRALRGINLQIRKGERVSIFGPNGAGKTTLIEIIATLSKPSGGKVRLGGSDNSKDAVRARRQIGVVSHQTFLYDNLTAYENLKFYGRMYDVPNLEQRITDVIDQVGLKSRLHDRVGILSRGMQQRVSIARAMIHDPPIMLLDEPETGLDQHACEMLGNLLTTFGAESRTVLMTTHDLQLGLAIGTHVMILDRGKVVFEGPKQSLDLDTLRENYFRCIGARQ